MGRGKNSWLIGTAAWSFVAVTQWILGIRPKHDGLRIEPCLPPGWGGYRATRHFRGATYRIRVHTQLAMVGRVRQLGVDGEVVPGALVPIARPGAVVEVTVHVESMDALAATGMAAAVCLGGGPGPRGTPP